MQQKHVTPPYIPIETQKRMHEFFVKTLGSRLLEINKESANESEVKPNEN